MRKKPSEDHEGQKPKTVPKLRAMVNIKKDGEVV